MGKQARLEHRQAQKTAQVEAMRRAQHQHRRRPFLIVGGTILVGVLVVLAVVATSGGGSAQQLPSGTQISSETGHQHVTGPVHYDRNPPAGGNHNGVWLNCGVYTKPVPNENAVHSLEHGAVWITYRPNLSRVDVGLLQQFVGLHLVGTEGYVVLSPYPGLPAPVVASAWGAQIRLKGPNDPRLAAFVMHFSGGAQGNEKGGRCTGGTGLAAQL